MSFSSAIQEIFIFISRPQINSTQNHAVHSLRILYRITQRQTRPPRASIQESFPDFQEFQYLPEIFHQLLRCIRAQTSKRLAFSGTTLVYCYNVKLLRIKITMRSCPAASTRTAMHEQDRHSFRIAVQCIEQLVTIPDREISLLIRLALWKQFHDWVV